MFVAVDANVVLSALLTKGKSFDVFAINKLIRRFEFNLTDMQMRLHL